jgi:hypothetical protein
MSERKPPRGCNPRGHGPTRRGSRTWIRVTVAAPSSRSERASATAPSLLDSPFPICVRHAMRLAGYLAEAIRENVGDDIAGALRSIERDDKLRAFKAA